MICLDCGLVVVLQLLAVRGAQQIQLPICFQYLVLNAKPLLYWNEGGTWTEVNLLSFIHVLCKPNIFWVWLLIRRNMLQEMLSKCFWRWFNWWMAMYRPGTPKRFFSSWPCPMTGWIFMKLHYFAISEWKHDQCIKYYYNEYSLESCQIPTSKLIPF